MASCRKRYNMPDSHSKLNIFIAFSPEDQAFKSELEEHLNILKRNGKIDLWHNQRVMAGENLNEAQAEALQKAQIILLLISSDFLSSDDAYENEVLKALERHKLGEARVVPVILRDCLWKNTQLGNLLPLPTNGKPVKEWESQDVAFKDIAAEIDKLVNRFVFENGKWVYKPAAISELQNGKPLRKTTKLIAGALALLVGVAYTLLTFFYNTENETNDRNKILPLIQGTWMNPNPNDNFMHKITFEENRLKVYSLGQSELIYWGEQELELVSKNKCRAHYPDFSFDMELVPSALQDTMLESIIAIYQATETAGAPFRNSKLYREESLELIAMHPVKNSRKNTSDSLNLNIRTGTELKLEELELTPRMILDTASTSKDTVISRVKTETVQNAVLRKAALKPDNVNLNLPDLKITDTTPVNKLNLRDTALKQQIKNPIKPNNR